MKIRNGFVSNSSSSSFVLVTSVEHWETVKAKLCPYEITVAEAIKNEAGSFLGTEVVSFSTWFTSNSNWTDAINVSDYDEDDGMWDAWEAVFKALHTDPTKVYEVNIEM